MSLVQPENDLWVPMDDLCSTILKVTKETTQKSRDWMEKNPNRKLPENYVEFSGKLDHASAVCFRVGRTSTQTIQAEVSDHILPMVHPITGIQPNEKTNEKEGFSGNSLVRWISTTYGKSETEAEEIGQLLLSFSHITEIENDDLCSTLRPSAIYRFKIKGPVMTKKDWEIILKLSQTKFFPKDALIIKKGDKTEFPNLFQVSHGLCKIVPGTEETPNRTEFLISSNEIFGEINFLEGLEALGSVIAATDVEVKVITHDMLNLACALDPSLAGRFYHYLGSVLARRLRDLENENPCL